MAAKDVHQWIPVYCTTNLPTETIDKFLERASSASPDSYDICLITTRDVATLEESARPPAVPFDSPFNGKSSICGGYVSEYTSSNPRLSEKAFVYLDKQTGKDGNTCCIVGAENACVRATFKYSRHVINYITQGTRNWLQLQNDAAMAGGTLEENKANDKQLMTEAGKSLAEELQAQDPKSRGLRHRSGAEKFIPLFCTANIPPETLNDFLTSTYDEHRSAVGEDPVCPGDLRLVTDTSTSTQSSPTKPPLTAPLAITPFISFPLELLRAFTELKCGGDSPLGNSSFIILDEHTTSDTKTCIVALNDDELEPGVQLVRSDFRNALQIANVLAEGVGSAFQEFVEAAALENDGVYRT
ncbi:MAG: hypothetical protein M1835_003455 [Candelina submexicana]|nr:MAG: hypothetical protein M1835_003455 [Candelina submexicana]